MFYVSHLHCHQLTVVTFAFVCYTTDKKFINTKSSL